MGLSKSVMRILKMLEFPREEKRAEISTEFRAEHFKTRYQMYGLQQENRREGKGREEPSSKHISKSDRNWFLSPSTNSYIIHLKWIVDSCYRESIHHKSAPSKPYNLHV